MRPQDRENAQRLNASLLSFDQEKQALIGIHELAAREAFIEQILESIRRVNYTLVLLTRELSERSADPNDVMFDPLKSAILHLRKGDIDEAFWSVFLYVHFGKHASAGWRYTREIYGRFGDGAYWDWATVSANPPEFRKWLHNHQNELRRDGIPRGFGNHRKYQSLDAYAPNGTGAAFESYVKWVGPSRNHQDLMHQASILTNGDPAKTFDYLYRSMNAVESFGRVAKFDYLAMVGKLGLASIEPGFAYLQNSTGPIKGARLLFGGYREAPIRPVELENKLAELDIELKVGKQVLEDALCNWQKNPGEFKRFRG